MNTLTNRTHFVISYVFLGTFALFLLPARARSSDVWKTKPVREWTQEEIRGFLLNSPWVRQVTTGRPPGDQEGPDGSVQTQSGRRETSGAEGRAGGPAIDMPEGGPSPGATYYIEWSSAKIVRAANVRLGILQGRIKQDPGEPPPLDTYVLTVGGPDLRAFSAATEPQLQATAYLRAKHSKTRVEPKEVKILRRNDRVVVVTFTFPRQVDGQPIISDQEKSVEFSCKHRALSLKVSFDLGKMAGEQGRDL